MDKMTPERHQINPPGNTVVAVLLLVLAKSKLYDWQKNANNLLQWEPTAMWNDKLVLNEMFDLFTSKVDF